MINKSNYCESMHDGFMASQHVASFNSDNYELNSPDNDYYYDRSGLKGNLFKKYPVLTTENKQIIHKKEIDNFNSIINKLELYYEDVYK